MHTGYKEVFLKGGGEEGVGEGGREEKERGEEEGRSVRRSRYGEMRGRGEVAMARLTGTAGAAGGGEEEDGGWGLEPNPSMGPDPALKDENSPSC